MLFLSGLLRNTAIKLSVFMLCFGFLVLIIPSLPTVANHLLASLESVYLPTPIEEIEPSDYIVVLGGSVEPPIQPRVVIELGPSADRVFHAWRLFRAGKAPVIIVSGGRSYDGTETLSEAFYMKRVLVELGVPEHSVVLESRSKSTHENAINTLLKIREVASQADIEIKDLLDLADQKIDSRELPSILLVTSATHLPRALAVFRKIGVNAIPAATDIRHVAAGLSGWRAWVPNAMSLSQSSIVLREMFAIFIYRLRNWA